MILPLTLVSAAEQAKNSVWCRGFNEDSRRFRPGGCLDAYRILSLDTILPCVDGLEWERFDAETSLPATAVVRGQLRFITKGTQNMWSTNGTRRVVASKKDAGTQQVVSS